MDTMHRVAFIMVVFWGVAAGLCPPAFSEENRAAGYTVLRIAEGVPVRPGAGAWSPDGRRLAFSGSSLHIYHAETGRLETVPLKSPRFLAWSDDEILVIHGEEGRYSLSSVDAETLRTRELRAGLAAGAVFPTGDPKELILFEMRLKSLSFGTDVSLSLDRLEVARAEVKNIYSFSKTYVARSIDLRYLQGWVHAGANPLDGSFLVLEMFRPPVVAPYSGLMSVDPLTGKKGYLEGAAFERRLFISGSWSPDGRKIALSGEGGLEVLDLDGGLIAIDRLMKGAYPSWNPKGSRIFSGGFIIDSDGRNREEILPAKHESIGWWSPDGRMLAVSNGGELLLFKGFIPVFAGDDKPLDTDLSKKVRVLKELFRDRLISGEEYAERYKRLIK